MLVTLFRKDPEIPRSANDPDLLAVKKAVEEYVPGAPFNSTTVSGYFYGEQFWEAARMAARSPLGLSRLGLIEAATHLDFQPKTAIPGVRVKLDGLTDTVAIESAELSSYDAKASTFNPVKLYDFEGQLSK